MPGFPRFYAAASLKPRGIALGCRDVGGFPRFYAAASLKHACIAADGGADSRFSAVLCRGLIEAVRRRLPARARFDRFSAVLCRGLIEARHPRGRAGQDVRFSAVLCRGLIEARLAATRRRAVRGFPRFYAAASLKRPGWRSRGLPQRWFSAVLCRGLIEAGPGAGGPDRPSAGFSAVLCRGLIEAPGRVTWRCPPPTVFRGSMPRPH